MQDSFVYKTTVAQTPARKEERSADSMQAFGCLRLSLRGEVMLKLSEALQRNLVGLLFLLP